MVRRRLISAEHGTVEIQLEGFATRLEDVDLFYLFELSPNATFKGYTVCPLFGAIVLIGSNRQYL